MTYINEENLKILKDDIGEYRFNHSLEVAKEAETLANIYGVDKDLAKLAATFHDCGKWEDRDRAYKFIKLNGLKYSDEEMDNFQLLHAPFGADIARLKYGIDNREVLNAIKYHTTMIKDATMLEKIIYVADATEHTRKYEGVKELRELSYIDIDKAILKSLDETIISLTKHNKYIGTTTVDARNYFLKITKSNN